MHAPQRPFRPSIIQRLLDEPYRFEPAQAMRMLELWFRQNGRARADGWPHYVRFHNSLSMRFPASDIESLTVTGEQSVRSDQGLQMALASGQLKRITLTPAFMGFFGVNGVMPNCYTSDIADQIHRTKFEGSRAFFDIFFNRIMSLHFQAGEQHRVLQRVDERGDAAVLPMQLALAGARRQVLGEGGIEHRTEVIREDVGGPIPDEVVARYAPLLRHRPVSCSHCSRPSLSSSTFGRF